jgi:acyltransferase
MDKRDNSIDIAKGLGVFLVIWGHLNTPTPYLNIYSFHMPLFFLLSGIFHKQQISFSNLIQTRSRSLLLPYVFFSFFSYLFYLVWALLFTGLGTFDFYSIYKIVSYKDAVSVPLWFFISLFQVTIIYYILKKSVKKSWALLLITLLISVFSYCISQLDLSYFYNFFHFFSSFSMLFFYALGCEVFKDFRARIVPNTNVFKVLLFIGILLFFEYVNTFSKVIDVALNIFESSFIVYMLAAISGIYGLWLISVIINKLYFVEKFWSFIGKNSMGIFAIHISMFELARPIVNKVVLPGSPLSGFIIAIVTLIISAGINEMIKIIFPFIYGTDKKK